MKSNVDFVFIVLIYRAYLDLYDLCESLKMNVEGSYEVVGVEAFYNEETSDKVRRIAQQLNCRYVQVQNGGYSFGNNKGLDFAEANYQYKYVCICNPDTILTSKLSVDIINNNGACIAPYIIAKNGRRQNPYWVCENKLSEYFMYIGYKNEKKALLYLGIAINKLFREAFGLLTQKSKKKWFTIYACHGSFFILDGVFIKKSGFRFDEKMFLFYEEAILAYFIRKNGEKVKFCKDITVMHKEDSSMKLAMIEEFPYLKSSYLQYYQRCRKLH